MYLINVLLITAIGVSVSQSATVENQNQSYVQVNWKNQARLITGGNVVTDRRSYPYHASLQLIEQNTHLCSASLIDKQNLLTSAYCLHESVSDDVTDITEDSYKLMDAATLQVVLGHLRLGETSDNVVTIPLKYIFVHEDWSPITRENDVAVIRLAEEITETDYVKGVGIATSSPATGTKCISSGWGLLASSTNIADLREVSFAKLANTACSALISPNVDEFCGLSDDGSSCQGELGSPVICNNVQAGIVSFYTCMMTSSGPITDVAYHSDWIKEQQNRSGSSSLMSSAYMLCFCIFASIYSYRNW